VGEKFEFLYRGAGEGGGGLRYTPIFITTFFLVTIAYKVVPSSRLMSHFVNRELIL